MSHVEQIEDAVREDDAPLLAQRIDLRGDLLKASGFATVLGNAFDLLGSGRGGAVLCTTMPAAMVATCAASQGVAPPTSARSDVAATVSPAPVTPAASASPHTGRLVRTSPSAPRPPCRRGRA